MKFISSQLFSLALILAFACNNNVLAQGSITVSGSATTYDVPALIEAKVYTVSLEKKPKSAFSEVEGVTEKVVKKLSERASVKNLVVSDIKVEGTFDNVNGRYAYAASQEVIFKMDSLEAFPKLLDNLFGKGINGVVDFEATPAGAKNVELRALEAAIKDARSKAEKLAKSSGMSLGKVISIEVVDVHGDYNYIQVDKSIKYEGINTSKVATYAEVRVVFELK